MIQFVVGWLRKSLLLALKSALYLTLYLTKASNPTYSTTVLHPSMALIVDIGHMDICLYIALWEGLVGGWHERKCIPSVDPCIPLFALSCSYIYSPFCNLLHKHLTHLYLLPPSILTQTSLRAGHCTS